MVMVAKAATRAKRPGLAILGLVLSVSVAMAGPASGQSRAATAAAGAGPAPESPAALRQLRIANRPWYGDFDRMLERPMIRVDAPYSRSLYFNDKGRER